MTDTRSRTLSLVLTLALLGLNLLALNYLVSGWSGARLDLTRDRVFSISPATQRILGSLDEDLTVYGYFSKRTHPKLSPLVPQIIDLLDEYRAVSRGRVRVEIVDPGQDEAAEAEASDRFGVSSTPFQLASKYESGIVNAYFALVIRYGDQYERYSFQDLIEVEVLPDGDIDVRLRNLEYDLTRAIKKVVSGFRGSDELFERVQHPVKLTAIVTPDTLPEIFAEAPDALRTAAEELSATGGDKFSYEELDPSTDPELARSLESRYGTRPMSVGLFGGESFYLYGLLEVGDRLEQLYLTGESVSAASVREAVENSLRRQTPGFLKVVGVASSDPPEIPPQLRMQMQLPPQPPPEFEELKRFLGRDYEVRSVSLDDGQAIPSEVDVLLVLKPKNLDEAALFALDQYLMRGGRIVICSGKYETRFDQYGLGVSPVDSGLDAWLAHHGLTVRETLVLDDRNEALPIPETRNTALGTLRTWSMAPYPYLVHVRDEGLANRDVAATLDAVGIYWGSPLEVDEAKTPDAELIPLLRSSQLSWTDDDTTRVGYVDYVVPEEGTEPQLLAAALSGRFTSFFAGELPTAEPPTSPVGDEPGGEETEEDTAEERPRVPLVQSPETRLVLVGNAEFLSDLVARSVGRIEGGFFLENLRFVENVVDWVGLDNDMIAIRSRGLGADRLERVERSAEMTIETVNYGVPVVALVLVGLYLSWRRRNTLPIVALREAAAPTRTQPERSRT